MSEKLLEISHLTTEFLTPNGIVQAVRDVSYNVAPGEVLGIVGESGSGKSQGMYTLMGLLASNGRVVNGTIKFNGKDISPRYESKKARKGYEKLMRTVRGNEIGMIFQDPMTFLNPILKVGTQLTEGIRIHTKCSKKEARKQAIELLRQVGIPSPEKRLNQYPFEFSGGMRQRIVIAIAIAANPELLICDEPTTALDVTIQAQILELINRLKKSRGMTVLFITHDLGVVANVADTIAVMYAGKVVETGTAQDIFYSPAHPYTWALLSSMPDLDTKDTLEAIPGTPPNMLNPPKGDAFAPRNKYAMAIDFEMEPPEFKISQTHYASTWLLHPNAPKVQPPKSVTDRIERMKSRRESHAE